MTLLEMQLLAPTQGSSNPTDQASASAAPQAYAQGNTAESLVIVLAVFAAAVYGLHLVERVAKKG